MGKWTTRQKLIAIANYKKKDYLSIARQIGKKPDQVFALLSRNHIKKIPNYTEMETYILQNFPVKVCAQFIPHKTINALKIKQCRLRKCTPVN